MSAANDRLSQYLEHARGIIGYQRGLERVRQIAGGERQVLLGSEALAQRVNAVEPAEIETGILSLAGAVAGGIVGAKKGHPVLGVIAGGSLGTNVPALLKPSLRKEALWNLAQTHAAVLVSSRSPNHPVLAFLVTALGIGAVRYFYGGEDK